MTGRPPILVNSLAPAAYGPARYALQPDDRALVIRCLADAILAEFRVNSPAMVNSPTGSHHAGRGRP